MEFRIRRARLTDTEAIAELYLQFWKPHRDVDPLLKFKRKITLESQICSAKRNIRKRHSYTLVADQKGKLIGFIEFFIKNNEDCFKIKRYGYLNAAATRIDYRGRGVAKALTIEALKILKAKKIKYIRTNVYNKNKVALKTWTKLGFKPQSTLLMMRIK
ncbi:MAG: GNAT family N-acetyltransferase [archaeon]